MTTLAPPATMRLTELAPGQEAQVAVVHSTEHLAHRLAALGFRVGKSLLVMRQGALSGPLHVRLGTTDVILRRSEAAQIEVLPLAFTETAADAPSA
ncbi:MAG TPA: FeoA family protein [Burkholderiales bacterium]